MIVSALGHSIIATSVGYIRMRKDTEQEHEKFRNNSDRVYEFLSFLMQGEEATQEMNLGWLVFCLKSKREVMPTIHTPLTDHVSTSIIFSLQRHILRCKSHSNEKTGTFHFL